MPEFAKQNRCAVKDTERDSAYTRTPTNQPQSASLANSATSKSRKFPVLRLPTLSNASVAPSAGILNWEYSSGNTPNFGAKAGGRPRLYRRGSAPQRPII